MSEQTKTLLKRTVVKDGRSPIQLSDDTYADIYYLGEAWKEEFDRLLGDLGASYQLNLLKERLDMIETVISPLTEEYFKKVVVDILKDGKKHRRRNIVLSFPNYQYGLITEIIEKLKAEGKITESHRMLRVVEP